MSRYKAAKDSRDRVVVLTNGREYVTNWQEWSGIVGFGPKQRAMKMSLYNAVDAIKSIGKFGFHKLYAEEV